MQYKGSIGRFQLKGDLWTRMTDHQKETLFLRKVILYGDTAEAHRPNENMAQVQGKTCVRRAVF